MKMRRNLMKSRLAFVGVALIILMMFFSSIAFAEVATYEGGFVQLKYGQVLDSMGFFAGTNINIEGDVEGTTFAAGQNIVVSGDINGDLFVAGQTINILGNVTGNIYVAGNGIVIDGASERDTFAAGQQIRLGSEAIIGRDLTIAGAMINLDGTVGRDLNGGAANISINGMVGRDAKLEVDTLNVSSDAVIGGDLNYRSEREGILESGSTVMGQTDWTYVDRSEEVEPPSPFRNYFWKLLGIGSALLIWLIMRLWQPTFWKKTSERIYDKPLKTMGIGALVLIVTPIIIVLFMITVIGIPVGILLGMLYGVSIYVSKIIVATFLGYWAMNQFGWREIHLGVWLFLLGYVILMLLTMIPYFGGVLQLFIIIYGLGALLGINLKKKTIVPPEVAEE